MAEPATAGTAGILATFRELPRYTQYALLGVFINSLGLYLQAFMVPYLAFRGFSAGDAGVALGFYAAGSIAGTFAGGWCSDRFGERVTIGLAVGGASLMTAAVTVLPNLPTILVAVFLAGGLTLVSRPAVTAMLLQAVPMARQVMVQAMYRVALNAGAITGPLLAALLAEIHWNLVFYADALFAAAFAVLALATFPRHRPAGQPAGSGAAEPGGTPATEPGGLQSGQAAAWDTVRSRVAGWFRRLAGAGGLLVMVRDLRYAGFLVVMLVNGLVHVQQFAVLPVMLDEAGHRPVVYGAALTIGAVIVVVCELPANRLVQRWPLWVIVLTGWLMLVAGRGGFGLFDIGGLAVVYAAMMLGALGPAVGGAAAFTYPGRVAPPGAVGRYIGASYSIFQIGYTFGPFLGLALWLQVGDLFWGMVAVVGLLTAVLLVWSMRPADAAVNQPPGADDEEQQVADGQAAAGQAAAGQAAAGQATGDSPAEAEPAVRGQES